MKKHFSSTVLIGLLLLGACEAGPDYERPSVETPAAYKEAGDWQQAQPSDAIDRGDWWSVYQDPTLDALEKQINISNQNIKAAEAAYRDSAAIVQESQAALFPTLMLNTSATRSGTLTGKPPASNLYNIGGTASWTPDLWGGIRRAVETDEANAQVSAAALASARLSAQGALATDYFDLRMQDELKKLLTATVDADTKALKIVQNQYNAGIAAKADVLAAQTQLENVHASNINADVKREQLEHAIAVLIGVPPAEFNLAAVDKFTNLMPNTPAEVPSAILQRRPDIAGSERQMAAANAQIGVEVSAFFPDITLSASYGYTAVAFSKLLQASNSLWSVGPALAETVFDAGAREARVDEARALYDQQVATYRQTVLTAFQQVEDNLSALRILADQTKVEDQTVADARKSEQLTLNQYKEGIVPYSSVLTAQTTRLGVEETALAVTQSRFEASVALIQAMGGGWDVNQLPNDANQAEQDASPSSCWYCWF